MISEEITRIFQERHDTDFSTYVKFCLDSQYDGDEYSEMHHILPRSTFPQFVCADWNVVRLKYLDHIEAHTLLAEQCPIKSYIHPLNFMLRELEEYKKRHSTILKRYWIDFKQSPEYKIWHEKRVHYSAKTFARLGERYNHIVMMNQLATTPEANRKRSVTLKQGWTEERRRLWGESVSSRYNDVSFREKMRQSVLDVWKTSPQSRKDSIATRNRTIEMRKKNSDGVKKAFQRPEVKLRQRTSMLGNMWWTNGIKDVKSRECPGPDWRRGRYKSQVVWTPELIQRREQTRKRNRESRK